LATFFFLGPLGVGVALLATHGEMDRLPPSPPKRKVAEGRQRFTCPRCGADNDLPNANTSYDCWRCGEHRNVKPKVTAGKTTS
jgi:DNA-directed RNA polymerase subunit RPC12/RpoP